MTFEEALAYFTPHPMTGDGACIGLTAGKMREAIAAIQTELQKPWDARLRELARERSVE